MIKVTRSYVPYYENPLKVNYGYSMREQYLELIMFLHVPFKESSIQSTKIQLTEVNQTWNPPLYEEQVENK